MPSLRSRDQTIQQNRCEFIPSCSMMVIMPLLRNKMIFPCVYFRLTMHSCVSSMDALQLSCETDGEDKKKPLIRVSYPFLLIRYSLYFQRKNIMTVCIMCLRLSFFLDSSFNWEPLAVALPVLPPLFCFLHALSSPLY